MLQNDNSHNSARRNGYFSNGHYNGELLSSSRQRKVTNSNEVDLMKMLATLLRRKWTVISITALGVIAAGLYIVVSQPVYESSGTILITESTNSISGGSELQDLLAASYGVGLGSQISNELHVMKSRTLSEALADRILEEDLMSNGQRFPILWEDYSKDSTVVDRRIVATRIRENLNTQRLEREADVVQITFESYSPLEAEWLVNEMIKTYSELSTDQNRMAANAALNFLDQELQEVEQQLTESEETLREFMGETGMVQVDIQAELLLQRMSELEGQRQEIRTRLVAVNSAIQSYENQLETIRPGLADRYTESIAPMMERFQFQLAELETERILLLSHNPRLRENPGSEPQLQEIDERIAVLKQEINRLASQLVDDESSSALGFLSSPDGNVATLLTEISNRLIELQVEETQFSAQLEAVENRLGLENDLFNHLPDHIVELARYQRNVMIHEQLFETISRQHAETALWEQTQFGPGRAIDYASVPIRPIKPRTAIILMIGFILGSSSGTGFVLAREALNREVDGVKQLKDTGYPLLAVIPDMKPVIEEKFEGRERVDAFGTTVSSSWIALLDSLSPLSEAYRRLHNNIVYSHPDDEFRTLLITSSIKGEGKSTVTANLAVILTEAGKRVLIIDTDLRRPNVHKLTGMSRSPGVVEYLFGDVALDEAVRPSSVVPGVDILTAGREAPNPTMITQSRKFRELILSLQKEYDHILIDTPPYGIITDSAPMIQLADGVIVVSQFAVTKVNELDSTLENLNRINARVLGTVLNGYKHAESADYYNTASNQYYYNYEAYERYHDVES